MSDIVEKYKPVSISSTSNTKLINLRYKYLGYYLGVRRQESGVRMKKFETIFYVVIVFFVK